MLFYFDSQQGLVSALFSISAILLFGLDNPHISSTFFSLCKYFIANILFKLYSNQFDFRVFSDIILIIFYNDNDLQIDHLIEKETLCVNK